MILNNVLVHHVHFWLKDKADLPQFLEGLKTLTTIAGVNYIHIGVVGDTHGAKVDRSYDAALLTIFDDLAAHDAYQVDPIHQAFLTDYVKVFVDRVVVTDGIDA